MKNSFKSKFVRKLSSLLAVLCVGSSSTFGNLNDPSGDPKEMNKILETWNSKIKEYMNGACSSASDINDLKRKLNKILFNCHDKVDEFDKDKGLQNCSFQQKFDEYNNNYGDLSSLKPKNCRVFSCVALKNLENHKIKSGYVHINQSYSGSKNGWGPHDVILYSIKENGKEKLYVADLFSNVSLIACKLFLENALTKIKTGKNFKNIDNVATDIKEFFKSTYTAVNYVVNQVKDKKLSNDQINRYIPMLSKEELLKSTDRKGMLIDDTFGFLKVDAIDYFVNALKQRTDNPYETPANISTYIFTGKNTKMPNGDKENAPLLTEYLWQNYQNEMNNYKDKKLLSEVFPKVTFVSDKYRNKVENFDGYKKVLLKADVYVLHDGTLCAAPRSIDKVITP